MKKINLLLLIMMFTGLSVSAQSPATYINTKWYPGQNVLRSGSGKYLLIYQKDGNLVLYRDGNVPIWSTNTVGTTSNVLIFQTDGNFVLYHFKKAIWGADCHNKGGNYLVLQDDGNLVIYTANNKSIWASNTVGK